MKKRILSILLVLALCLTLMPMTAFAADDFTITNDAPESAKETNHGYITIDKTSAAGDETVTLTVTPSAGYQLKAGSLKVNDGAVTITCKGIGQYEFTMPKEDVAVTAEFEQIVLPYFFDFESDFIAAGWTNFDADGDGQDWITGTNKYEAEGFGVEGSRCAISQSFENVGTQSFNADNWLFSPAITIPAGGAIVSWYEQSQDKDYPDSYEVYICGMNTSTDTSGMTQLYSGNAANPWAQKTAELSAKDYGGKTVYIAFRHHCSDCYFLEIDNFAAEAVAPAHTHSFTYTANNGKITATCVDGCDDGYDTTPLTLTLTAPASLVYDGNAKAFTFADGEADAWTGAGLELPTITYYQKYSGQGWYTQLTEIPLNAGGDYMAEIVVNNKAAQVKFTIDKATPYIKTTPAPNDIEYGKKLSDSTLFGGYVQISSTDSSEVGGLFEWTNPDTVPGIDDSEITEYDVTFTPADMNNYNTVSCKITIKVTHTHNLIKVTGQAATETTAGFKDYYGCNCGALSEDENGTTPIENLDAWKSSTGNGYLAPLVHTVTPVNGQDATDTEAGYKAYYECKNCGKYYEDATGLIEIPDINVWKAEGGAGYLAPLIPAKYTVTFNMGNHGTQIDPQTVEEGSKATKPSDPTAEGWTFGGWYADATFSVTFNFDSAIDANTTIYAKWTKNTPAPSGDSTPIVTVPITGNENSVKVSATVSGSTATIKDIKDADLAKVTGGESVEIGLTGLKKDIETAKIPTATVEKIGEQAGMSVKLTTATVSFDKTATQEISDQAKGNTVELVVDDIKEVSLNAVQKEAVQKLDTALIIDAYLVSGGTKLCTENRGGFNGGKATVILPYELKSGSTAANYSVYYVAEDGTLEKLNAKYDTELETFVFEIEHFSVYAVAYSDDCPQDETCVYARFTDADTKARYHDGVHFCVENGYMQGVSATAFDPAGTTTRAMIVTMLWRMEGEPVVNYAMSFKDVKGGQWYTEAIRWAQSTGVVDGYSADSFGPNDNVTREQLAAILYNYAKIKGQGFTGDWMFLLDFVDRASVSEWADEAVHWCSMKGIVNGKDGKVFDPQGKATRAEAASMVQRFCETMLGK